MSRTKPDVVRSLRRHVAAYLDNDFDVRIESDDTAWTRPSCIIDTAPQVVTGGPKVMEIMMPVTLYAYPKQQENGEAAKLEAMRVEDLFVQAFRIGGNGGRPCRIPLFDYDIELEEVKDVEENVVGYKLPDGVEPEGMIWLLDFNTDTRRDPEDETLQTVLVEGRLRWARPGEQRADAPLAKDLEIVGREIQ